MVNWTIGGSMSFSAWFYIDQPMNNMRILDMAVGHDNENIMIGPIGTTTRMYAWWLDDTAGGRENIIKITPPSTPNGFISPPLLMEVEPTVHVRKFTKTALVTIGHQIRVHRIILPADNNGLDGVPINGSPYQG